MTASYTQPIFAIATACVCYFACAPFAYAYLPKWFSETRHSPDGRFVLVTISDRSLEEEIAQLNDFSCGEPSPAAIRQVREKYAVGGLYDFDDNQHPLWTDNKQWWGVPVIAPDGRHVLYEGDWGDEVDDGIWGIRDIQFQRDGKILHSYYADIIPQYPLKFLLNGWQPPACVDRRFDAEHMTYTLVTNQGETFIFDVTTGKIIGGYSPFPRLYALATTVVTALLICGATWWRKKSTAFVAS
jgi:hypothetical protein